MSINQLPNNELSIEIDMRDLLRAKKEKPSNELERAVHDFSGTVFRISGRSVQEIDHLIEGLQGVREKLNFDGVRLESEIAKYAEFSDLVVQLTKIVSDSMAHLNKTSHAA
jgi:hypothetical protein